MARICYLFGVLLSVCGQAQGEYDLPAVAAAAAAAHDAIGAVSILSVTKNLNIWEADASVPQIKAASDKAPAIDPDLLAGIEDKTHVLSAAENYGEAQAYNYLLLQADTTSAAGFARSARRDVTFAHLFEEPGKYRGQVVHIEGRLKRLRRFDAPRSAAKQGVPVLYEGWIFGEAYFSNPYCVIATAVPQSIPLAEKLDQHVSFDGYFFKRYRYQAGDGWRDAPLLIGHALVDQESGSPRNDSGSFANLLLPILIAVFGISVVLVAGLHWWFRRADRRLRNRLEMTRKPSFIEPGSDA
jgi:hypothetical protein